MEARRPDKQYSAEEILEILKSFSHLRVDTLGNPEVLQYDDTSWAQGMSFEHGSFTYDLLELVGACLDKDFQSLTNHLSSAEILEVFNSFKSISLGSYGELEVIWQEYPEEVFTPVEYKNGSFTRYLLELIEYHITPVDQRNLDD